MALLPTIVSRGIYIFEYAERLPVLQHLFCVTQYLFALYRLAGEISVKLGTNIHHARIGRHYLLA